MEDKTKNLFVSHIHEDDKKLQSFKDLLIRNGYNIRDGSIDSSKPNEASSEEYIKQNILAPRIQWAGCVVVLISAGTHESTYVNWEIEYAQLKDKRIIGVYTQGAQESDLPDAFEIFGDALVGWQADQIAGAINGDINNWYQPDGVTERAPRWNIKRINCQ